MILFLAFLLQPNLAHPAVSQWTSIGPEGGNVVGLVVDPNSPNNVYANTGSKILKSTNGGGNWNLANSGLPTNLNVLVIDPNNPNSLYVGALTGVFKSTDGGANWNPIGTGLPSGGVIELAVDPQNPATLYAGIEFGGVYRSIDGGTTWIAANNGLPTYPDYSDPPIFYYPSIRALAIDPFNSNLIYAGASGGEGGLFKTINGGASWNLADSGLPIPGLTESWISELVIDPTNSNKVYALTGLGPYKTEWRHKLGSCKRRLARS